MKSIQDFKDQESSSTMKAVKSYSKLGIDQILDQLFLLLNEEDNELDGIFYLKNRSPLMTQSPLAYITNYKGADKYKDILLGKELFYSSFPRWRNISNNNDLAEIDLLSGSSEPLCFKEDKSFLVSSIREENHNWGMLVCFSHDGKAWSKNQLKLIESFSKLLCATIHFFHQQEKDFFLMQQSKSRENSQNKIIERLEQRIEKKNKLIEKLKSKSSSSQSLSASFNWSDDEDSEQEFDEVWVTIHGYKNGQSEPAVSKWEKITEKSLLNEISNLFFSDKSKKKAV